MSLNRRTWRLAAPLAVLALLAGACSSSGSGSSSSGGTAAAPQAAGKADLNPQDVSSLKQGGDFRWAINDLPTNFNQNQIDGNTLDSADINYSMMPRPFLADAAGTPSANADYFSDISLTSQDPQVITYTLNPKAKWNDGRAISWEDFDAQAKALSGKDTTFLVASSTGYSDIAKVEQGSDASKIVVTFANKFSDWQSLFGPLYPKEVNATADAFNTSVVAKPGATAGPFKFSGVDLTAKKLTVVPDPAWWGPKPVLASITYVALDQSAQVQSLVNNEIDYSNIGSSVNDNKTASQAQGVTVRQALAPDYRHVTFNGAAGSILADKDLRIAVMKGINRDGIAQALLNGVAQDPKPLGNHIYVDGIDGYKDNSSVVAYDPTAAGKALDDLGWVKTGDTRAKDGKTLEIRDVIPTGVATSAQEAQIVQQNLAVIGVKVDIQTVPSAGFFSDYVNVGNFDITHFAWIGTPYPISSSGGIYQLKQGDVQSNFGQIGSTEINDLFTQANAELDPAKKIDLANQIDTAIWAEGFSLLLYQRPQNHAVRSTVANFGSPAFGDVDYTKIGFMNG